MQILMNAERILDAVKERAPIIKVLLNVDVGMDTYFIPTAGIVIKLP